MDLMPMFPLSIVVFPGEKVNLHIFEPRYRQLIHEAEEFNITFGIPLFIGDKTLPIAPEIKLDHIVKTYNDGKMDVTVQGIGLLNVQNFQQQHPSKLYPVADIQRIPFDDTPDLDFYQKIVPLIDELYEHLNVNNVTYYSGMEFRTVQVLHKVGLTQQQEIEFLACRSEQERAKKLLKHLQEFLPTVIRTTEIKTKAAMNGHFKNLKPLY